jgi:hypothetical protein
VAKELNLDWHTVKELDKHYMREQLRRVGTQGPKVIGIDELSIKKRHQYRIVVSDLIRERPIWFGGTDRSEASMDEFYHFLRGNACETYSSRRDGHVAALSELDHAKCPSGSDPVRQVPHHQTPRRSPRQGT